MRAVDLESLGLRAAPPATFYAYAAAQPCIICTAQPVHLHHIAHADLPRRGHALERYTVLPLCLRCHQTGPHAAHRMKQSRWEAAHGINISAALLSLYGGYARARDVTLPPGLNPREAAQWLQHQGL